MLGHDEGDNGADEGELDNEGEDVGIGNLERVPKNVRFEIIAHPLLKLGRVQLFEEVAVFNVLAVQISLFV